MKLRFLLLSLLFAALPVCAQVSKPVPSSVPAEPATCPVSNLYQIAPGNSGAGNIYANAGTDATTCALVATPGSAPGGPFLPLAGGLLTGATGGAPISGGINATALEVNGAPAIVGCSAMITAPVAQGGIFAQYPSDLTLSDWVASNATATAQAESAPDCTTNGYLLVEDTSNNEHHANGAYTTTVNAGESLGYIVWAKQITGSRNFQMQLSDSTYTNGISAGVSLPGCTILNAVNTFGGWTNPTLTIMSAPGGWCGMFITATAVATTTLRPDFSLLNGSTKTYTGDGVSSLAYWGASLFSIGNPGTTAVGVGTALNITANAVIKSGGATSAPVASSLSDNGTAVSTSEEFTGPGHWTTQPNSGSNLCGLATLSGTNWAGSGLGPYTHSSGSVVALTASGCTALVAGQSYLVTYTQVAGGAANVTPSFGGLSGSAQSASGTYTQYGTATSTTTVAFTPVTGFTGTITLGTVVAQGPKATSCGTPVIVQGSTDRAGKLTTAASGCVVTFQAAYTNAPACHFQPDNAVTGDASQSVTNSALTVTATGMTSFDYECTGLNE